MTLGQALVSVVIPVYNRERFVEETLDSVFRQTWPHLEVIAVDDGSTDGSRAILESFGNRLRILEHPGRTNRGQSAALNLGLHAARGDYVALLDSDDFWLPEKLALQVDFLDRNPDIGLVYCNGWAVDESGRPLYRIYEPGHREFSRPERVLKDCYFLLPNNALVRMDVMRRAGLFDETLRAAQDHDMAIRIAEITRIAYIDVDVFRYRRHPDSISRKRADLRWRNGFHIVRKASTRYPYSRRDLRARTAVLHFRLGQCHLERRELLSAGWHFMGALARDPLRAVRVLLGREQISSPH